MEVSDNTAQNKIIGGERVEEPSVLFTKIVNFRDDPKLLTQLRKKLEEYEARELEFAYTAPDLRLLMQGPLMYTEMFKLTILKAVLGAIDDESRDLDVNPILMPEIALVAMDERGLNITSAITTPFVKNPQFGSNYYPDFKVLTQGDIIPYAFSDAYSVIQAYTSGNVADVTNGTGLPDVDTLNKVND